MIVRRCAGGVVFYANKVLIVKNDRGEWTLPKGKILGGDFHMRVLFKELK
ncbi:hypothetical protein Q0Y04_05970 [Clostridioides difficile]|nr:hypothetical protein Q0Y04_05970 [Clostridioides difficile]